MKSTRRWQQLLLNSLAIILGNALYSLAVALFLEPAGLITGGATGIALAFGRLTGLSVSGFLFLFNMSMLVWGWAVLGKKFALNTLASSVLSPAFLALFERLLDGRVLTEDIFLCTIFSGLGIGVALGMVIRAGASTGGMDIPPLVLQKWFRWPVSITMMLFDIAILLVQAAFSQPEQVLYGIVLVITHAHGDHVGGLGWFDDYYMNKEDVGKYAMEGVDFRRQYAGFIAQRSGKEYAYNVEEDIRPWPADLEDGQTFDLGGGRIVTAMRAPGHTPGSMVLIDPTTRILFAGDACNCNTLFGSLPGDPTFVSVETAGKALKDIYALKGKMWDKCYNGHHDFRPLGAPLADDVMPNLIDLCDQLVSGNYEAKTVPGMFPNMPERTVVTKGTVMVTFKEGGIHEPKK